MTEYAERYDKVAATFTQRVGEVRDGAWDNPAPCEGWVARDVVRHLVEWVPGFFSTYAGIELATGPSVDDDPAGAWAALDGALRRLLADPAEAARSVDSPAGQQTVGEAIDTVCTPDVLVHTWDLARATGLDERLDAEEVRRLAAGIEPIQELLVQSGHYGPATEVPDGADEQTRLLALTGRRP